MEVKLVSRPTRTAQSLAQHAARTCYEGELPGEGLRKRPGVKGQLLDTGHHTTLEHGDYTFSVEGCAIGDITFGFHYTTPYYNTDQRSGRYTTDMFNDSGLARIDGYLDEVYPGASIAERTSVRQLVTKGMILFHEYMPAATLEAARLIRVERPKASQKFIEANAKKFAQEQLRASIPVIFPTAFYFSANLITIISLYRTAWKPGMRRVLRLMMEEILRVDPKIDYMFGDLGSVNKVPNFLDSGAEMAYEPTSTLIDVDPCFDDPPPRADIHPFDLLPVSPEYLCLKVLNLRTREAMSVATMGQDQRHRSVRRSAAEFTGSIYVPPLANAVGMENGLLAIQKEWIALCDGMDPALHVNLAPYGAMVTYVKSSSFDAAIHDLVKRSCWNAQEEHYNKDRQVPSQIEEVYPGHMLVKAMLPPCHGTGVCGEGSRCCGRDMQSQFRGEDYLPRRLV